MRKAKKRTLQLNAKLAQTLTEKGVEATADETTTALIDKVAEISTGSEDSYYDVFWDAFQDFGKRTVYEKAFMTYWNDENFKPKYDLILGGSSISIFQGALMTGDFTQTLKNLNIMFDTSKCTNMMSMFQTTKFTKLPHISCANSTICNNIFYGCMNLETIEKITVAARNLFSQAFNGCNALKNIVVEGEIGTNIAFAQSSLLTNDSVQSIINALIDLTDTTTQTLTLHKDVKSKLSESQISAITGKNWTLA